MNVSGGKIRLPPPKMADLQVAEFNLNVTQAVRVNERQVIKNGSDYSNNVHFSTLAYYIL